MKQSGLTFNHLNKRQSHWQRFDPSKWKMTRFNPMRVMKTYLKARSRLSDLLKAQKIDRMTSNLKRWIENGSPDKGDLEKDSYRTLRQYCFRKQGRVYLKKDGIVACKRREEDRVLYKYNAIVLPQLYQTVLLFRSHDQMCHKGIDKVYQMILKRFDSGMKTACEKWVTACVSCQKVKGNCDNCLSRRDMRPSDQYVDSKTWIPITFQSEMTQLL